MDLRVGALKARVDHVAPMVIDLEEPEVRQESVELVLPPAPPVVQQALDTFGAGLLQAVAEWGTDEATKIYLDNDDVITYNPESVVVEIRDFTKEERQQAQEPGLTKAMEVERAAAFPAPEYEDPPAYEP